MKELEEGYLLAGRYEIRKLLGEGGMARVYEAWCRVLQRRVAIKFLRPELLQDEELASAFHGEARAAARLSHPNIVPIFDVGETEEGQFIVMEYVEGPNLKQYLKQQGALPVTRVVALGKQVASALKYAHDLGIVHRDIKPHNILLGQDGVVKVADFGLARVASESTLQVDRQALGSIHYCAPEQARGGFSTTSSDIYSLGVVLYEMATGQVPFMGENAVGIVYKHLHADPTPPGELRPDIPEALDRIVLKCLQKHQGDRYSHAGLLFQDLEAAENGAALEYATGGGFDPEATQRVPIPSGESGAPPSNRRRWRPGRRLLIWGSVLLALLLLFGLGRLATNLLFPPTTEVPDVVGMDVEEARMKAEESNLVLEVAAERHDQEASQGTVLEQEPEPGTERRMQSPLRVVISLGPEMVEVPDLLGMTRAVAETQLENLGLTLGGVEEVYDDQVGANLVAAQHPPAGTELDPGASVDLSISRGAPPARSTVPDLRGRHRQEAADLLEEAGLQVGRVTEKHSNVFARNYVIQQSPGPNALVEEGSSVRLTVSLGPEPHRPAPPPEPEENDDENEEDDEE